MNVHISSLQLFCSAATAIANMPFSYEELNDTVKIELAKRPAASLVEMEAYAIGARQLPTKVTKVFTSKHIPLPRCNSWIAPGAAAEQFRKFVKKHYNAKVNLLSNTAILASTDQMKLRNELIFRHYLSANMTNTTSPILRIGSFRMPGSANALRFEASNIMGRFSNINIASMMLGVEPFKLVDELPLDAAEMDRAMEFAADYRKRVKRVVETKWATGGKMKLAAGTFSRLMDTFKQMHANLYENATGVQLTRPLEISLKAADGQATVPLDFKVGDESSMRRIDIPCNSIVYYPAVEAGESYFEEKDDPRLVSDTIRVEKNGRSAYIGVRGFAIAGPMAEGGEPRCSSSSPWAWRETIVVDADGSASVWRRGYNMLQYLSLLQNDFICTRGALGRALSRCLACNLPLTDAESMSRGFGAVCYESANVIFNRRFYTTATDTNNDIVKNLVRPLNMSISAAVPIAVTTADDQELHIPVSASNMLKTLVDDLGIQQTQIPFEAEVISNLLRIVQGEHFDAANVDERMGSKIINLADYLDLPELPVWLQEISEKLQRNMIRIV